MRIYPAIDIIDGRCVRLKQGRFDDVTVYNDDPVQMALTFQSLGASYIHVVDLDAARHGGLSNAELFKRIASCEGLKFETGGGVRSLQDIEARIKLGIDRVIIGTKAVTEPQFVIEAIKEFGAERIVAGLDGTKGMAATHGWEKESGTSILELGKRFAAEGLKTIIYTDISRDGMLSGPDIDFTKKLVEETGIDIIASGGVSCEKDLENTCAIGCEGTIVGKAYYEGKVDLEKVLKIYRS